MSAPPNLARARFAFRPFHQASTICKHFHRSWSLSDLTAAKDIFLGSFQNSGGAPGLKFFFFASMHCNVSGRYEHVCVCGEGFYAATVGVMESTDMIYKDPS